MTKEPTNMTQDELFKVLVAHCKEYGFIFPSSEIYDGLAAVYDYGQMVTARWASSSSRTSRPIGGKR